MAEARHLDDRESLRRELLCLRQQLARTEAVAYRPGADAQCVERDLQERVERDDFVHLAAANVHVVGERVGKLGCDRPHLAADAPEIVEQARSLARELGQQQRSAQNVDAGKSRLSAPTNGLQL